MNGREQAEFDFFYAFWQWAKTHAPEARRDFIDWHTEQEEQA